MYTKLLEQKSRVNSNLSRDDIWFRPPVKGHCPYSGFSRAFYYQLIKAGKIKSVSIKKPGCLKGVRLINLGSVLDFVEAHLDKEAC